MVSPDLPLRLLGSSLWIGADGQTRIASGPNLWLLAYLAAAGDWVERSELAELLWPEVDAQDARNNLRQLLHRHKNAPWYAHLEATPQALRLVAESDLQRFRRAFEHADWAAAMEAYGGELLEGARASAEVERWLETERAALHNNWREALIARIAVLEARGDVVELPELLARLLDADPYNDEAMHSLLRLAERGGDVGAALRQFQRYSARLGSDLGAQPHPETARLAAQLAGLPAPARSATDALVGRDAALRELIAQLTTGARLVTVRGAGGVGKTALAKTAFDAVRGAFSDGATWVSLRETHTLDDAPRAIAATLRVTLDASSDAWTQVSVALQYRQALLALDNAEHLNGLAEKLYDLTQDAARLTLLVTSRVALGLPEEWVLPLTGLEYPASPDLARARDSSAVQLFVERAARRRGSFALSAATLPGILRVCAAVDGLPLGLELAAAWSAELSPEAIADGLEASADISATPELSVPDAHRSLRAVFEHSWELLDDELREALEALSVFQGGFERRAAIEGAGVSARALLALVARSLVNNLPTGRYDLHPVVQGFAVQKLEAERGEAVRTSHARYFAQLSQQAETPLRGGATQARWLERLTADHQNILAALTWTSTRDPTLGAGIVGHLDDYWHTRGYRQEGLHWARLFLTLHHGADVTRLKLLWTQTSLTKELAEYDTSMNSLLEYQTLASALGDQSAQAGAIMFNGMLKRERGHADEARALFLEAETRWQQLEDQHRLATCLSELGGVEAMQNNLPAARERFEQALALKRIVDDKQGIAYALANLGNVSGSSGDFALEKTLQEESLMLKRELGDVLGIAWGLSSLGANALDQDQIAPAKLYLSEALEVFMRLGKRNASVVMLDNFSRIAQKCQVYPDAIVLAAAADHLTELIGSYKFSHWDENHRDLQKESGFSAAELQTLETQGKNLSLAEAAEFALSRQQLWLENTVTVSQVAS